MPRRSGMLFPVFSMRRKADLGIGDTTSVRQCLDWLSFYDISFLQLLPINVSGSDNSPYSAISSVALDFIYLDMAQIPELSQDDVNSVRSEFAGDWLEADKVDYTMVRIVKSKLLRLAYERYQQEASASEEFKAFMKAEADWLVPYCKYRWLMEESGGSEDWTSWPTDFNTAEKALKYEREKDAQTDGGPRAVQEYYAWVQWHAFSQWRAVRDYADTVGVKLMGDIPIGVSNASADVFFEPQWFMEDWYGGAPPETVFKDDAFACKWGQNWGVPLYNWDALQKDDFSWWKRRIHKLTDVFHIFRIDHILGFYRIYAFPWHPKRNAEFLELTPSGAKKLTFGELPHFYPRADDSVTNKAKNLMDGDVYLKAILEAAKGYEVVGEDLGCVPDYVRPHLAELGIAGFKICHWETNMFGDAQRPEEHPDCAFTTYATHDHPSIRAMWEELRHNIANGCDGSGDGLKIISQYADLPVMAAHEYPEFNSVIKWAMLEALMKSGARYAALMITDILDSKARINAPGTVGDHNWTYRVDWNFEAIPDEVSKEMGKLAIYTENYDRVVTQVSEKLQNSSPKTKFKTLK
ncbi:MAG: 4-alpha-glucanotransferase [Akkermansiaceae bacterium]